MSIGKRATIRYKMKHDTEFFQVKAGNIYTTDAFNRWKLAAGGRPSKARKGDKFRHQENARPTVIHAVYGGGCMQR